MSLQLKCPDGQGRYAQVWLHWARQKQTLQSPDQIFGYLDLASGGGGGGQWQIPAGPAHAGHQISTKGCDPLFRDVAGTV